ncbi:hypothetical protein PMAYCL1PPCAC_14004 [Pristionchus mayeri]|uniref:Uncharacterized protein n=1 Tax=Pristionchus mayeri TaxID=1317129 RepID=A0AAN4ZPT8_9BILA|nr:hypothetical protein PMAYCL1PPCAC_14004 [Pristionchus mayeri]
MRSISRDITNQHRRLTVFTSCVRVVSKFVLPTIIFATRSAMDAVTHCTVLMKSECEGGYCRQQYC